MKKLIFSSLIFALFAFAFSPVIAAPDNFGGNGSAWNNDYGNHYENQNNSGLRMDWTNHQFAVPGEGGDHANDNAAIRDWGGSSLVQPLNATNKRVVEKVLPSDNTKGNDKTPPGQGGTPPGQEDDGDDTDDGDDSTDVESGLTGTLGETATGTKYAVVIGVCNYPGTANDICWSDGDSLNMYDALRGYGFDDDNIYVYRDMVGLNEDPVYDPNDVTDGAATFSNVESAVSKVVSEATESGDEVVFFFSGHGGDGEAEDDDNESVDESIILHDGNELVHLWDGQLRSWFSDIDTSRVSFVFDSCLAGGMDDVAADGRVVSMATDEKQPASVYSTGSEKENEPGEGVFSHYFVNEGILQGYADTEYHKGDIAVEEAFKYADDNINGRQKPTLSDNFPNDLLW